MIKFHTFKKPYLYNNISITKSNYCEIFIYLYIRYII